MVQTPRLALHLRNVIPVTPVTPRGDGLWSIDAHAIAVGAGVRGTGPSTHHVPCARSVIALV
jgi:hypothetical protein